MNETKFNQLNSEGLAQILDLTIKHDKESKIATFLCLLSAYTEDCQFNIIFNAPSSTGKSYIPTEIGKLFPPEDVVEIGYCSPTAFFHDNGTYNKEKNQIRIDLSKKILIFLDQPHSELLTRIRPLLSHDKKEIAIRITDKTQKAGTKTKHIILIGYPSVIFCTASLRIDEQETTRCLILSPEQSQNKIHQSITSTIEKEADCDGYNVWLNSDEKRILLKERIEAIKQENIREIKIDVSLIKEMEQKFISNNKSLKPRHQRDIKRLLSLVKTFALLNLWWRKRDGSVITANKDDIEEAFKLWSVLSISQELNLSPYIYNLYTEVIVPAWEEKNKQKKGAQKLGITRRDILEKHYAVYKTMIDVIKLRQQILPMLETSGLIIQEQSPMDKRQTLIFPTSLNKATNENINSE